MEKESISILLIEDDEGDRQLFEEFIKDNPMVHVDMDHVNRLSNARDILIKENKDVIFLDLGLPDSKGLDTLESCLKFSGFTPIIVLTGLNDEEQGMEAVKLGAQDYLIKNKINGDILVRSMNYAVRRVEIQNELIWSKVVIEDLNSVLRLMNKILRHDLSNFLHFISGSLTLHRMKHDNKSLDNAEFYVQKCYHLIEKMKTLEGVLVNEIENDPVEIGPMIEEYVDRYPFDIEVQGNCRCYVSKTFTSIMDNIIDNAIKHGGSEKMRIEIVSMDNKCQIRFIDHGKGIPKDIKNNIFNEGFSHGDTKGTGLGLYIVKRLVERSGDRIWIEDNEPTGAVIVIEKDTICK